MMKAPDMQIMGNNFGKSAGGNVPGADTAGGTAPVGLLRGHYKDITFDTLKERHDNFSFDKVITTKHKVYDTMHFEKITTHPTNPDLLIFKKMQENRGLGKTTAPYYD